MVDKPQSAELHAGPGFRIRSTHRRPDPKVMAALAEFDTPAISDLMNRLYAMSSFIKCLTPDVEKIAGPACTVKVFPGDNLMVHKSLDVAQPGDVVVIDTSNSGMTAVLGDLISTKARHRGIAGFVVDGLVRDLPAIQALKDFPVFARGTTPIGPLHRGPGEINYLISAGGVVVHPGDVIVGDVNGVVVIPRGIAEVLLQRLQGRAQAESEYRDAVARGDFSNRWIEPLLSGVEVSQETDRMDDEE
jgi:regulator of RNase E activity RraA